ncbi:MAG: hypothetical protein MJY54_02905 [archaeon]|nr:hypothetical protein [archaeon]
MSFRTVIEKYRKSQFSKHDLGNHFERLMRAFLKTYQPYDNKFENVWLWNDFPYRYEFGKGQDIGIDIVCKATDGEYWAVQCKCYGEGAVIDKSSVDKDTHIKNDPNDWSKEHENPRYILDLLLKVITVSMKTMEIVEKLPLCLEPN